MVGWGEIQGALRRRCTEVCLQGQRYKQRMCKNRDKYEDEVGEKKGTITVHLR